MKIYVEGEATRGICKVCRKQVPATFCIRSVPLSKSKKIVKDILVSTCDVCQHVLGIPQQSAPQIKEVIRQKHSIEVRLPIHLRDVLALASDQVGATSPDHVLRFYISEAAASKTMVKQIKELSRSEFSDGAGYRLSLKVGDQLHARFESLLTLSGLTKTQLLKALILFINHDLLQRPSKKRQQEIERVLLAAG
ncbi:MAG: hypothetical protein ACLGG7_11495 [Bacteriovoracia bacterium]